MESVLRKKKVVAGHVSSRESNAMSAQCALSTAKVSRR